jgi:hypothetical protein
MLTRQGIREYVHRDTANILYMRNLLEKDGQYDIKNL